MVTESNVAALAASAGSAQVLVLGETEQRVPVLTLLVKFTFKRPELIPEGIPRVDRPYDYQVDVAHQVDAYNAGQAKLGRVGRIRKGRVDTGEQVIAVRRPVHAGMIRRGLASQGFSLQDLHWYSREDSGRGPKSVDPKYVVVASFVNRLQNSEPLAAHVRALRELAAMTWAQCFVWDNPNSLATINFVGKQGDGQQPKHAIVARGGKVTAIDIVEKVAEAQE